MKPQSFGGGARAARLGVLLLGVFSLTLFLSGVPGRYQRALSFAVEFRRPLHELGLSAAAYATYLTALDVLVVLIHFLMAAIVFRLRARERMGLLVALTLMTAPLASLKALPGGALLWAVSYTGMVVSIILLYLFPDGRFVPGWTRPLATIWAVLMLPVALVGADGPGLWRWLALPALLWSASGVYAQIHRYRHVSSPLQRQQTKWAVVGIGAAAIGPVHFFLPVVGLPSAAQASLPNVLYQLAGPTVFAAFLVFQLAVASLGALALILFPASFAVAILRYRLWDIDVLLNRTLVYASLTAALTLLYLAGVIGLQHLFNLVIGQQSGLAIAISTLGIAALFQPLRLRMQRFIDRRLYRRKYDAVRTLAHFGESLRQEVDLHQLSERLTAVVQETMEPEYVILWLRQPPEPVRREP